MTNKEAVTRFEQANGANIANLFWIAGSHGNSELHDMIDEMDEDVINKVFPNAFEGYDVADMDSNEIIQCLFDSDLYGFIAEIHIPRSDNFSFDKDGNPTSWSTSGGISGIAYVYAEDIDALMIEIEKEANAAFEASVKKFKSKNP